MSESGRWRDFSGTHAPETLSPGKAMTRSSQHHTAVRSQRACKTPAVAPITRAVRAALAMSVTMLALSAPAMAAGTCGLAQVARDSHV